MSLQGSLRDFPVADVFQLVAQQRKTGLLQIENEGRTLEVAFLEGQVLRARPSESRPDGALGAFALRTGLIREPDLAEAWRQQEETLENLPHVLVSQGLVSKVELQKVSSLLSDETIFEVFLWDVGRFNFRPGTVKQEEGDVLVAAEMVLLDALRMRDEWAQIQTGLANLASVISPSVDIEVFREHRGAVEASVGIRPEDLERLFALCDGRLSARRIIDLARLGTFQGARGIVAMLREGLLHVSHVAKPAQSGRGVLLDRTRRFPSFAILALSFALATAIWLLPAPTPQSFPVPTSAVAEVRSRTEWDRLRLALEAERWVSGGYPEVLQAPAEGYEALLAPVPLDRYSYSRADEGYRLHRD